MFRFGIKERVIPRYDQDDIVRALEIYCLPSLSEAVSGYAIGTRPPTEILQRCRVAAARNDNINAIVHANEESALLAGRASARRWAARSPLSGIDGIPVVVKANIAVSGLPWTAALACFSQRLALGDSAVVARLCGAGAVIAGIANMDEGALGATTSSALYGPCQNPLRKGFTPGGSSGGSAAAVAAGFCIGAIGTDTMGSVRIPAAYCGIVGFKPSYGRIPLDGVQSLCPALDHIGLLARCVGDLRALYDNILEDKNRSFDAPYSDLRIGLCAIDPSADRGFLTGVKRVAAGLERLGASVGDFTFEHGQLEELRKSAFLLCERDLSVSLADNPRRDQLSSTMRSMLDFGASVSGRRVKRAVIEIDRARRTAGRLFKRFDALIMPTTPSGAFAHGARPPRNQADFTVFANAAGAPALAFPIGLSENGLPLSLQIVTRTGAERLALQIGESLENLRLSQNAARVFL